MINVIRAVKRVHKQTGVVCDSRGNLRPIPSDEVHEDFVLHDAGDRGHPALRHRSSLTRHQDLTYTPTRKRETTLTHRLPVQTEATARLFCIYTPDR